MKNVKNKRSIMIYETDAELSKSFSLILEQEFDIIQVSNIKQVLSKARKMNVDALILDLDPKLINNIELFMDIKSNYPKIKILSMYVYDKKIEKIDSMIRKLSDAILYKPIDIKHFIKTVKEINNHVNAS